MSQYLLNTNHQSPLVTYTNPLRAQIMQRVGAGDRFFTCAPSLTEFLYGIQTVPRAVANVRGWEQIKQDFPCIKVDVVDAEFAAQLQAMLKKRGWQLDTVDALIAAVALRYDLILLTRDGDFDAVPNLQIENWIKQSA